MRQSEVQALIPPVLALAAEAGQAIMAVYERAGAEALQVARKGDQSPLTEADLAAHRVLVAGLLHLTPGIPVVSEEDAQPAAPPPAGGWFWLIDPLDGTKEFIARNGEFTVNVALVHDGCPVLGVVLAPALHVAFWGGLEHGAFRRQGEGAAERIRVAPPVAAGASHRVVASRAHLNAETESFIARLGAVDLVQAGSSLKFCRIAEGAADVYPRLAPTCEWDTAAAQAVVEGAGGHVLDLQGKRLRYGKPHGTLNPHFVAASAPLRNGAT